MRNKLLLIVGTVPMVALSTLPVVAQTPLGYVAARLQTVTPAFEGWYLNPDGTKTLSFGYYNRNREEVLEIPLGSDNLIEPAQFDGGQPTRFDGNRHWGVFGIIIPGDYTGPVAWTLKNRGKTFMIPANLKSDWAIDALLGEASGNMAPELATAESGPWIAGPGGLKMDPVHTKTWTETELTVWARDDGYGGGSAYGGGRVTPVTLTWFKHSGPGDVTFSEKSGRIDVKGGSMATIATFTEPGEYIVRVRANDSSGVSGAGHSQYCWTNGFVRIAVN